MPYYQMLVIHTALYLSFMFCLETPQDGLRPTNFSFARNPACPGTQYTLTTCQVQIPFGNFIEMETLFWQPEGLSDPPDYQSKY